MSRHVGGGGDGGAHHSYGDIGHVLARLGVDDVTIYVGIGALGDVLYRRAICVLCFEFSAFQASTFVVILYNIVVYRGCMSRK